MKILYHHRTQGRGVEAVHIRGLVGGFEHLGHSVEVVSVFGTELADEHGASETTEAPRNWRQNALAAFARRAPQFIFELLELGFNLVAGRRLSRRTAAGDIDVIYERYSLFLFATVRLARRRGIPIILEINDSAIVERVRPLFLRRLAQRIERYVFGAATGLVFVSTEFETQCRAHYRGIAPSVVLPNCADLSVFNRQLFDAAAIRQELGIDHQVVCGYVGAFVPWHGIDWFIDAVIPAMRDEPRLSLLLVGDGAVYEPIRSQVERAELSDRIILTGRVPHGDVARYIAAMDYAILPDSNNYGSPMKVFELMAMSVPLVAPGFPPLKEVIDDRRTGWLFPPNDHEECVRKVIEVAGMDADNREAISAAAAAYIVEERQWHHNARDTLGLLEPPR